MPIEFPRTCAFPNKMESVGMITVGQWWVGALYYILSVFWGGTREAKRITSRVMAEERRSFVLGAPVVMLIWRLHSLLESGAPTMSCCTVNW